MTNLSTLFAEAREKELTLPLREYELHITSLAKAITCDNVKDYEEFLYDKENTLEHRFSCFFVLFTYYRKNGFFNEMKSCIDYAKRLFTEEDHPIFYHVKLMGMVKLATISDYKKYIAESKEHLETYKDFAGFLNQYVELCARYYELNLDERFKTKDEEKTEQKSKKKKNKKETVIVITPQEKSEAEKDAETYCDELISAKAAALKCIEQNSNYPKFHANLGRIYALMGKYDKAEKSIMKGIALVPNDSYHGATVASFENYYENITSIVAFDRATAQISEVSDTLKDAKEEIAELRAESFRNVSIVSAAMGLLLGSIQAFSTISDYLTLARVIIMYSGLFIFAIGAICLVTSLFISKSFKKKITANIISIFIAIIGLAMFLLSFLIH